MGGGKLERGKGRGCKSRKGEGGRGFYVKLKPIYYSLGSIQLKVISS